MTQLRGLVVLWDIRADLTVAGRPVTVQFARGSVEVPADASRVKLLADHDRSVVLGHGVAFEETGEGLLGTFELDETVEDFIVREVEGRLMDGLSPCFDLNDATRQRVNRGTTKAEGLLREVSLVAVPAYVDARAEVVA